ncbi:MAG: tetratricopeptide repeat protein [Promethearchaeota archaeon]|jgi:tetratricopeptide (TPR) repeat protein
MFVFGPKELTLSKQYLKEGKYENSLKLLNEFAKRKGITLRETISCKLVKSMLLFRQGLAKESSEFSEQIYKESLVLEKDILSVDALFAMVGALYSIRNKEKADRALKQAEKLLESMKDASRIAMNRREAWLFYLKGMSSDPTLFPQGDVDLTIKYYEQCLTLAESHGNDILINASLIRLAWNFIMIKGQLNFALEYIERALNLSKDTNDKIFIAWALHLKATVFQNKGEVNHCISLYNQSLAITKELNHQPLISGTLNNLADAYRMNGELDRALECSKQSIEIYTNIGRLETVVANLHDYLIQILIEKGDNEQAEQFFNKLEEINNQLDNRPINEMYLYNKALLLKESSRISNRAKAEEILKELLKEGIMFWEVNQRVLLALSDLLISELQMTGNLEALEEVELYIAQLLEGAEKTRSYWIWGETFLLQAKIALLSLKLKEARRLLTQGQKIAEKFGLELLARKISDEHDELLKKLEKWEDLKKSEAPMKERLDLSRVDNQMRSMIQKRVIKQSDIKDEDPIVILFISEAGMPVFSQSFAEEWSFQDHLFGGFLTAVNTFSDEMFSKGLDRASFGDYTLFMNAASPFLVCYLFKGQSYSAQQRIRYFLDKLQSNQEVWQAFEKYYQMNQEIQLKDIPSLEPLIKEVFIDKKIGLTH